MAEPRQQSQWQDDRMPDLQTQNESPRALPNNSYVSLPIVAIVGRPNVGKSSLFNRILGRRHAIVSEVSGTTRDRLISEVEWDDRRFITEKRYRRACWNTASRWPTSRPTTGCRRKKLFWSIF